MASKRRRVEPDAPRSEIELVEFRDDDHRKNFERISKRKVVTTRYLDDIILKESGIYDYVMQLFTNIGLHKFVKNRPATYPTLTYEFLSSLRVRGLTHLDGTLEFRLANRDFVFTLAQFAELLLLPPPLQPAIGYAYNHAVLWHWFTGRRKYDPSRAKAWLIGNRSLIYAHRVISNTLLARGNESLVDACELEMLCHMYYRHLDYPVYRLVRHLDLLSHVSVGTIYIGGVITQVANALKLSIAKYESVKGLNRIDGCWIDDSGALLRTRTQKLIISGVLKFTLPNLKVTSAAKQTDKSSGCDQANGDAPPPLSVVGKETTLDDVMCSAKAIETRMDRLEECTNKLETLDERIKVVEQQGAQMLHLLEEIQRQLTHTPPSPQCRVFF